MAGKKYPAVILLLTAVILISYRFNPCAYAVPDGAGSKNLPVKMYEHKSYKTGKEAIKAQRQGKTTTSWIWLNMEHEDKIELIDGLKRMYKEKSNTTIEKPSTFYINEMDLYLMTEPGGMDVPLGVIFKTIAIMEYDFDEGIDREETVRKWFGEHYEEFKKAREK